MSDTESRYSQPKLDLFGLYCALYEWRRHTIGAKKLIVEVDAKYVKGMLTNPDLVPGAAANHWIQGIKLFDFELVHVPADRHHGPDALSRRPLTEEDLRVDHNDSWLDDIVLFILTPLSQNSSFFLGIKGPFELEARSELSCFKAQKRQDEMIQAVYDFYMHAQIPSFDKIQAQRRFLSKCGEFFLKHSC